MKYQVAQNGIRDTDCVVPDMVIGADGLECEGRVEKY